MFFVNLRRLYYVCDKNIVRNLRSRRMNPEPNPGLQKRINAFQKDGFDIDDDDAEEYVEQSASDFYKVGESYNAHMNETLIGKYQLRHHIVKEKYFKENMPNLLTWSEKEQIRHLANTYPEEWTPEKIAESFPITVPAVKKLLKYAWKPTSEQRITRHDTSAMRNWRELKEGSLDIPQDLREHFLKFSERTIPPLNRKSIKIEVTQDENLGEFESIIKKCAAREEKQVNCQDSASSKETESGENNRIVKNFKRVTLDELTAKIKKRIEKGRDVDLPDKLMLNVVNTNITETMPENVSNEIQVVDKEHEEKELIKYEEKDKNFINVIDYPERIRIPKKAFKKGATYKVKDCYYDYDGRFLYRVLGMSD